MKIARNVLAGLLSGIGVVVLLQQYAVIYPTGTIAIMGVVVGIAVQFGVGALAGTSRRAGTLTAAAPTHYASAYAPAGAPDVPDVGIADVAAGDEALSRWTPTHRTPEEGLDTWPNPDPTLAPGPRLDAGLGVRVDHTGDGWARVVCENGWAAWVDASRLEPWL